MEECTRTTSQSTLLVSQSLRSHTSYKERDPSESERDSCLGTPNACTSTHHMPHMEILETSPTRSITVKRSHCLIAMKTISQSVLPSLLLPQNSKVESVALLELRYIRYSPKAEVINEGS
uniref:Uncharacterized protein n=1 Tax=Parascaris equorum TaxID=6256 RepID=A0A914R2A2_PAREQ